MTEANVVFRANFYRSFQTTTFILAYQDNSSQENNNATAPFDSTLNVLMHGTDYFNCIANSIIETKNHLHSTLTAAGWETSPTLFFAVHL